MAHDKKAWVVVESDEPSNSSIEGLSEILKCLSDPLLPVRGHGLIALRRLVLSKHPDAQANFQRILTIFQTQLSDEDTYIYLSAIDGLTALGDVYPKEIIPILTSQFLQGHQTVEVRLKISESLLKIAQRCGETLPLHGKLKNKCNCSYSFFIVIST